jgi:hypothetical protein
MFMTLSSVSMGMIVSLQFQHYDFWVCLRRWVKAMKNLWIYTFVVILITDSYRDDAAENRE